jgi:hypothetical protein
VEDLQTPAFNQDAMSAGGSCDIQEVSKYPGSGFYVELNAQVKQGIQQLGKWQKVINDLPGKLKTDEQDKEKQDVFYSLEIDELFQSMAHGCVVAFEWSD